MLVVTTRNIIYRHDMHPIPGNTILEVENEGGGKLRIKRGEYARVSIGIDDCLPYTTFGMERTYSEAEYVAVHQELLRRREQVVELEEERVMLLRQIERFVDEQKPAMLPREVVEAIEIGGYKEEGNQSPLERELAKMIGDWLESQPVGDEQQDNLALARLILKRLDMENEVQSG